MSIIIDCVKWPLPFSSPCDSSRNRCRLKPGPHQQQCRSNARLCRSNIRLSRKDELSTQNSFDIVDATGNLAACCFDKVAVFGKNVEATFDFEHSAMLLRRCCWCGPGLTSVRSYFTSSISGKTKRDITNVKRQWVRSFSRDGITPVRHEMTWTSLISSGVKERREQFWSVYIAVARCTWR